MKITEKDGKYLVEPEKDKVLIVTNFDIIPTKADEDGNIIETRTDERITYECTHVFDSEEDARAHCREAYMRGGRELTDDEYAHIQKLAELKAIRVWFSEHDYIPNKVLVGEWEEDDPRFVAYKEERAIKRARQDELRREMGVPV